MKALQKHQERLQAACRRIAELPVQIVYASSVGVTVSPEVCAMATGNHIILNGDSIDFLMNEDPLELSEARAVEQATQICQNPVTQGVLHAIGTGPAHAGEAGDTSGAGAPSRARMSTAPPSSTCRSRASSPTGASRRCSI